MHVTVQISLQAALFLRSIMEISTNTAQLNDGTL